MFPLLLSFRHFPIKEPRRETIAENSIIFHFYAPLWDSPGWCQLVCLFVRSASATFFHFRARYRVRWPCFPGKTCSPCMGQVTYGGEKIPKIRLFPDIDTLPRGGVSFCVSISLGACSSFNHLHVPPKSDTGLPESGHFQTQTTVPWFVHWLIRHWNLAF